MSEKIRFTLHSATIKTKFAEVQSETINVFTLHSATIKTE